MITQAEESILTLTHHIEVKNFKTKDIMYYIQCILFANFTVQKVDTDFVGNI